MKKNDLQPEIYSILIKKWPSQSFFIFVFVFVGTGCAVCKVATHQSEYLGCTKACQPNPLACAVN